MRHYKNLAAQDEHIRSFRTMVQNVTLFWAEWSRSTRCSAFTGPNQAERWKIGGFNESKMQTVDVSLKEPASGFPGEPGPGCSAGVLNASIEIYPAIAKVANVCKCVLLRQLKNTLACTSENSSTRKSLCLPLTVCSVHHVALMSIHLTRSAPCCLRLHSELW